jgi:hypothetical protein
MGAVVAVVVVVGSVVFGCLGQRINDVAKLLVEEEKSMYL